MGGTYDGLRRRISAWLTRSIRAAESLLSPMGYTCTACSGTYRQRTDLELCNTCMQSIPWIIHLKCNGCGRPEHCPDCSRRQHPYFVQNRSAVSYSPQMKEWLALYKYRGHEKLRDLFGTMLVHAYHMHKQGSHEPDHTVAASAKPHEYITYVPLSTTRLAERGFNQAQQMAEELGMRTGIPVIPLLERTRHTDKQSFKSRGDRLEDMQGVFRVLPESIQSLGKQALRAQGEVCLYLVDDVYTTGSTLNECARTILSSGLKLKIYGLCWAR